MTTQGYEPPEHQDNSWMGCVFWIGAILAILLGMTFLNSCSTTKYIDRWHTEYRDTTIYQKITKDSLIYAPIPLEKNQVIVEVGDTSRLETSVAISEAFVNDKGQICHTLENKKEKLPVMVPVTSTIIYTGVKDSSTHTITKTEYVEKSLSWWQSTKIKAFWWLLGAVILCLLYIFRKPLIAILKTWLKF